MASQFKNRLVGIIILVALVVIFLPSLIDGKKTTYQQEFVSAPIKPTLKAHSKEFDTDSFVNNEDIVIDNEIQETVVDDEVNEPSEWQVEEVADTLDIGDESVEKVIIAAKKVDVKKTTVKKTNAKKVDVTKATVKKMEAKKVIFADPAWTIQLGAFQNKANINSLLKKLNKAGFQAHTIPKEVIDGQLTRVFVGPDISKVKLEKKLSRLKHLTNLQGKLVAFNPIEP